MIKHKTKTTNYVDYTDLEDLFVSTYGITKDQACIPAMQESGNDSSLTGTAAPSLLEDYDAEQLASGDTSFMMHALIDDLCAKDLFPEGSYSVEVCW